MKWIAKLIKEKEKNEKKKKERKKEKTMEYCTPRNLFIILSVAMTMVVVLNTGECGATSSAFSLESVGNETTTTCVGGGDECLIAEQDMDLEFQMPSEISRRVLAGAGKITPGRLNANNVGLCGKPGQKACAGQKNSGRYIPPNCGGQYERSCQK